MHAHVVWLHQCEVEEMIGPLVSLLVKEILFIKTVITVNTLWLKSMGYGSWINFEWIMPMICKYYNGMNNLYMSTQK